MGTWITRPVDAGKVRSSGSVSIGNGAFGPGQRLGLGLGFVAFDKRQIERYGADRGRYRRGSAAAAEVVLPGTGR